MVVLFRHVLILSSCFLATALVAFGEDAADFVKSGIERGQKHDYAGAVEDFSKAIALKPLSAELHTERGLAEGALIKKGDEHSAAMTDALDDYNTAIKLKPNFAPAYYNRGNLMQFKKTGNEQKLILRQSLNSNPSRTMFSCLKLIYTLPDWRNGKETWQALGILCASLF